MTLKYANNCKLFKAKNFVKACKLCKEKEVIK